MLRRFGVATYIKSERCWPCEWMSRIEFERVVTSVSHTVEIAVCSVCRENSKDNSRASRMNSWSDYRSSPSQKIRTQQLELGEKSRLALAIKFHNSTIVSRIIKCSKEILIWYMPLAGHRTRPIRNKAMLVTYFTCCDNQLTHARLFKMETTWIIQWQTNNVRDSTVCI